MSEQVDIAKTLNPLSEFREIGKDFESPVKIYDTEGVPFWKTIADPNNKDILQKTTCWASACMAGQSRSRWAIEGFETLEIPATVRSRHIDPDQGKGIDHAMLGTLILGGEYKNGFVIPEDFDKGFNRLVIFYSDVIQRKPVVNYIVRILNAFSKMQPIPLDLEVVTVEVSEDLNRALVSKLTKNGLSSVPTSSQDVNR